MGTGFAGAGVTGNGMAASLLKGGFDTSAYTRESARRTRIRSGAALRRATRQSPSPAIRAAEVCFSPVGIPDSAKAGAPLIDMTGSGPRPAERIARQACARGLPALDAPVFGGGIRVRAGSAPLKTARKKTGAAHPGFCRPSRFSFRR